MRLHTTHICMHACVHACMHAYMPAPATPSGELPEALPERLPEASESRHASDSLVARLEGSLKLPEACESGHAKRGHTSHSLLESSSRLNTERGSQRRQPYRLNGSLRLPRDAPRDLRERTCQRHLLKGSLRLPRDARSDLRDLTCQR